MKLSTMEVEKNGKKKRKPLFQSFESYGDIYGIHIAVVQWIPSWEITPPKTTKKKSQVTRTPIAHKWTLAFKMNFLAHPRKIK
jgi:hypothetical protein